MSRFNHTIAIRKKVPLLIGLSGPSGGGKTYSALRLASGMQKVNGGEVFGIDTEANRMLHYADKFKFQHVPFGAPFNPLSYLEAIEYCVSKGAKTIVVDSMSHEHEGPGGLLEMHAMEVQRMAGNDYAKAERVKMLAWGKPKAERRRLLNTLLQIPCDFVFCFRAKEKLKMIRGQEPEKLGYMPIAGEEFVFEMTVCGLLLPNAGGIPQWNPHETGERMMVKLPEQFRKLLLDHRGPLDERIGEEMARWAAGVPVVDTSLETHRNAIQAAQSMAELQTVWGTIPKQFKTILKGEQEAKKIALEKPASDKLFTDPADQKLPD